MTHSVQNSAKQQVRTEEGKGVDIEILVGFLLLGGVLLSIVLILVGLAWHWARTGSLELDYTIAGMNLFQFVVTDVRLLISDAVRPRLFINLGIAVLMLTPYARVLVSIFYFAFVEQNWKYTLFTGFVLSVLTYSLFLR